MAHMKQKVSVTLKLPQLQNLIKRDPASYREEFLMQKRHFDSELDIFKLRPTKDSERFTELVTFMSHIAGCYVEECRDLTNSIIELLEVHATILHPDVRIKLFQALILMRNKSLIDPVLLIKLSFKLFSVNDKSLRVCLSEYIFNDIKAINIKKQHESINRSIQAVLFNVVAEDTSVTARKTVDILSELYRRRVWTDARTVNVIGSACLSPAVRVVVSAVNFFLGIENKMHEDEEEEKSSAGKIDINYHEHSKKTRKRQRDVQKQIDRSTKMKRDQAVKASEAVPLFPAIQMLHDPQSLAEKLFKKLRQSGERFEVKLLLMNFVSRLIGCHKLLLLSFYSFLQRYLTSHQQEVTHILAYLIQACHDLVPPEEVLPVIKAIAHNFITERCSNEVVSVGINSVREIIARVPSVLREPGMDDFVQDLVMYGRKAHKSVMVAAHGITNLVRDLHPTLLKKSDRGKHHNPNSQPAEYGQSHAAEAVDGVDLLEAYEKGEIEINSDDEVVWKEDGKRGSGGESDEEDGWEEVEESEEEAPDRKRSRKVAFADSKKSNRNTASKDEEEDGEDDDEEDEGDWESVEGSDEDDQAEDEEEEGSAEDDEVGGEWNMMSDDEDEPAEDSTEAPGATESAQDSQDKRMRLTRNRLDARRVLTDGDFAMIARLKAAQAERLLDPRYRTKGALAHVAQRRKQQEEDDEEAVGNSEFAVDPDSLAAGMRTGKSSKIERIKNVLEGRKEVRFEHEGHAGGLTNKEKLRLKNFVMVRKGKRSVSGKINKSNSDIRYANMKHKEQFGRDRRKRRRT